MVLFIPKKAIYAGALAAALILLAAAAPCPSPQVPAAASAAPPRPHRGIFGNTQESRTCLKLIKTVIRSLIQLNSTISRHRTQKRSTSQKSRKLFVHNSKININTSVY